jgi:arginine repressor
LTIILSPGIFPVVVQAGKHQKHEGLTMAKKGTGSKTRAVLDYIKAHPGVGNTEIAAALTKAGISITPSHVSTIKNLNKAAVAKAAGTTATSQEPVNKSKAIRDYLKAHPSAANSEVAAELTKQGIEVTSNFVTTIRARLNMRAAAKAEAGKKDGAISKGTTPASVNKSQAIRDYAKAHPRAANSEIVAELAKQGVEVTPNLVATVKAKKQKRREVVKEVVEKRGVGIPEIKAALTCLKVCGNVAAAKEALAAAEEIKKMFAAGE